MSFLVLILTILIEKLSSWRQALQKDQWWYEQLARCRKLLPRQNSLAFILALSLPILGLAILLIALKAVAYGLLLIPVHLAVLVYSLNRGDVRVALGPFRDAWRRQDTHAASLAAQRDLLIQSEEPVGLLQAVQSYLLWQGFQGFFAVIFFYLIAGPLAALTYRRSARNIISRPPCSPTKAPCIPTPSPRPQRKAAAAAKTAVSARSCS